MHVIIKLGITSLWTITPWKRHKHCWECWESSRVSIYNRLPQHRRPQYNPSLPSLSSSPRNRLWVPASYTITSTLLIGSSILVLHSRASFLALYHPTLSPIISHFSLIFPLLSTSSIPLNLSSNRNALMHCYSNHSLQTLNSIVAFIISEKGNGNRNKYKQSPHQIQLKIISLCH